MKTVKINLYSFNELSESGKEKAILEYRENELNFNISEEDIKTEFNNHKYLFLIDGEIAPYYFNL